MKLIFIFYFRLNSTESFVFAGFWPAPSGRLRVVDVVMVGVWSDGCGEKCCRTTAPQCHVFGSLLCLFDQWECDYWLVLKQHTQTVMLVTKYISKLQSNFNLPLLSQLKLGNCPRSCSTHAADLKGGMQGEVWGRWGRYDGRPCTPTPDWESDHNAKTQITSTHTHTITHAYLEVKADAPP